MSSKKTKSNTVLKSKMNFSLQSFIVFALVFGAMGYGIAALTNADARYSINVSFSASTGTWPTAVLDDPMSVALGRYNSDYGYQGEQQYGPVIHLTGTASGLKTNLKAGTSVNCGQTEPIPYYYYDTISGQWGEKDNGNLLMGLKAVQLNNGTNDVDLYVGGIASVAKIDRTKPMICYAQIYVTQTQGTKLTTAVPVTQKFTLQPN